MANNLPTQTKSLILTLLAEGNSIRSIARVADVSRNTVNKLLLEAGRYAYGVMNDEMQNLKVSKLQVDEIWTFVAKKQKQLEDNEINNQSIGDQYVFVALDADTKLVPAFRLGKRNSHNTELFMQDLRHRIATKFQLSTDGFAPYLPAVDATFGDSIDYGQIVKHYAEEPKSEKRYSPARIVRVSREELLGMPKKKDISTSLVERQNLTMRMQMRRFTRLTNAYSKKWEQLFAALSLHFYHYNFMRIHETIRVTPAMEAGLTKHIWTWEELLGLNKQAKAA